MTASLAALATRRWAAPAELRDPLPWSWGGGAPGGLPWEGLEEFEGRGLCAQTALWFPRASSHPGRVDLSWLSGHPRQGYYVILSAAHRLSDFGWITLTLVGPAGPGVPHLSSGRCESGHGSQ